MTTDHSIVADTGLEVIDILAAVPSELSSHQRPRNAATQLEGMQRIARAFVDHPETVLDELVHAAVDLCHADSAGISIEKENRTDEEYFQWIATAGQYTGFLNAVLPRSPSACSICLERGTPQRFRVRQPFFDILGVKAPTVTDGILLPWISGPSRGTIFVMAHGRQDAFDEEDCRLMQLLADFAAIAIRHQTQQKLLLEKTSGAAAAAMANHLAHQINNPLQSLTNLLYLTAEGQHGEQAKEVGRAALQELQILSTLVSDLLALRWPIPS